MSLFSSKLFHQVFPKLLRRLHTDGTTPVPELRKRLAKHVLALKDQPDRKIDRAVLAPRTMADSEETIILPLGSDKSLREKYLNIMGYIRFGMVLEDLDTFAVWLSYRHNQGVANEGKPPTHHPMGIVTACVDRIDVASGAIVADRDILLDGRVTWVGRSSLEATMDVYQDDSFQKQQRVMQAKFVMVALNPHTGRSTPVHPLKASNPEEEKLIQEGAENSALRKRQGQESLLKVQPTLEESKIQHDLFISTLDPESHTFRHRKLPPNSVWMEDCKLKNVIICFPQQRNLYYKVFGGFLMRSAFELAWANACIFSKKRPTVIAVDDIMFQKSVDIGSLLFLSSEVCYTKGAEMQVRVHAEVVDPDTGAHNTTNTFHFTFTTKDAANVPQVIPKTYADGMLYLSGKRHYDEAIKLRKTTPNSSSQ